MKQIRKKNRKLNRKIWKLHRHLVLAGSSRWTVHCASEKKGSVSVADSPSTRPVVVTTESDLKHRGAIGVLASRSSHREVSAALRRLSSAVRQAASRVSVFSSEKPP